MTPLRVRIIWPDADKVGEVEFELTDYEARIEIDLRKLPRDGSGDFRILGDGDIIPAERATVN